MVGELLQVGLLLGDLLLHLQELLLLALADGVVLGGLFALAESVAAKGLVSLAILRMLLRSGSSGHAGFEWRQSSNDGSSSNGCA